jgi:hypothetical protein
MRISDELMTWCSSSQRVHTSFKLLHNLIVAQRNSNLFENRQTVAQTVKLLHKQSNHTTHDQIVGAVGIVTRYRLEGPGIESL